MAKKYTPRPPVPAPTPSPFWPTSERVPDIFPNTQQTPTLLNTPSRITQQTGPGVIAYYRPRDNYMVIPASERPTATAAMHEAGHAIWFNDLTPQQRQSWTQLHHSELRRPGIPLSPVSLYSNDPSHSFAQAYGLYAAEPLRLQQESPAAYNLIRSFSGFEYRRPGKM